MVTSLPFLEYAVRKHHEPTLTLTKPGNRNHSRKLKTREVMNPTWLEFDQVRFSQTSDAKIEKGSTKIKLSWTYAKMLKRADTTGRRKSVIFVGCIVSLICITNKRIKSNSFLFYTV